VYEEPGVEEQLRTRLVEYVVEEVERPRIEALAIQVGYEPGVMRTIPADAPNEKADVLSLLRGLLNVPQTAEVGIETTDGEGRRVEFARRNGLCYRVAPARGSEPKPVTATVMGIRGRRKELLLCSD
jgi:hypothetical protein